MTSKSPTLSCTFPRLTTLTLSMASEPAFIGPTGSEISTSREYIVGMRNSPEASLFSPGRPTGRPALETRLAMIENSSLESAAKFHTSIPDIPRVNDLFSPAPMVSDSGPSPSPSNGMSYSNSTTISNNSSLLTKKTTEAVPSCRTSNGTSSLSCGYSIPSSHEPNCAFTVVDEQTTSSAIPKMSCLFMLDFH